jgi:phage-related protein
MFKRCPLLQLLVGVKTLAWPTNISFEHLPISSMGLHISTAATQVLSNVTEFVAAILPALMAFLYDVRGRR